ncbi:hypothetical protein CDAR_85881 [Caerostris darwini]|uniref:Uncharacterized protein n=1 Tax=Caerostris darwini TaxID=1538125 RepID=A0AAV4WGV0_9ARAC|nr:hypothetical protein CDAR_85881 [Caerostris darwini]
MTRLHLHHCQIFHISTRICIGIYSNCSFKVQDCSGTNSPTSFPKISQYLCKYLSRHLSNCLLKVAVARLHPHNSQRFHSTYAHTCLGTSATVYSRLQLHDFPNIIPIDFTASLYLSRYIQQLCTSYTNYVTTATCLGNYSNLSRYLQQLCTATVNVLA